jgi:hypothetical protein
MFVIPCKFEKTNPIIYQCVERIKKFHPNERILIVDSNSSDKSYYSISNVTIADISNENYGTNAFYYAFKNFPEEKFFYCIYDSLLLNNSLESFKKNSLTVVRHFYSPPTDIGFDENGISLNYWANDQMSKNMGFELPGSYTGVMGPMLLCKRNVISNLEELGFFNILPENKYQLCAMERIIGCALEKLGYKISENSIQGEMIDFFGNYDSTFVEKVNVARW